MRSAGKGHELAAARQVLADVPLAGRIVTGAALRTPRAISRRLVARGGDDVLPVDDDQPKLRAGIEHHFSPMADERA